MLHVYMWQEAQIILGGLLARGVLLCINENRPTLRETQVLPFNDI